MDHEWSRTPNNDYHESGVFFTCTMGIKWTVNPYISHYNNYYAKTDFLSHMYNYYLGIDFTVIGYTCGNVIL
jgi:hypothetical protein